MKEQFIGIHVDFIGFIISVLCAIHCAGLPIIISMAPLMGLGFLDNPWIEYSIIILSFFLASLALLKGYFKIHKKPVSLICVIIGFMLIGYAHLLGPESLEVIFTSSGALIVATAHFVNWVHIRQEEIR